jgi:hypothetical protein
MVPVNEKAIGIDKVRAALSHVSGESVNVTACRKELEEALPVSNNEDKHLGLITPEWQRARQMLAVPPGHSIIEIYADGMEVGQARTAAVQTARESGLKYIFFLDWDVIVPQDALVVLAYQLDNNPDFGVASGMYCMKSIPTHPLLWRGWNEGVAYDWTVGDVIKDRVVGVPMGCALLRLSLFDKLPNTPDNPWFRTLNTTVNCGGMWREQRMTEDLWFCKRFTDECQGKIMVDTGLLCDHICHNTGRRYMLSKDSLPWKRREGRT